MIGVVFVFVILGAKFGSILASRDICLCLLEEGNLILQEA